MLTALPKAPARPADSLPIWLWLVFPPLMLIAELASRLYDEDSYRRIWDSELGPIESGTVIVLLPGIAAGLAALVLGRSRLPPWLLGWLALNTAACVYFAGEEASWGQHWFGWQTPDSVSALNDQQETNIHNMSSWFDQKPRLLLELWVLIGGLARPAWYRARARAVPRSWFWPHPNLTVAAACAIAIGLIDRAHGLLGATPMPPFDIRWSESQEYYFALFLALYLIGALVSAGRLAAPERDRASG